MNKLATILILLLAIIAIKSCKSPVPISTQSNNKSIEWKFLKEDKFEVKYPSDWKLDKSSLLGSTFVLFGQLSDKKDRFRENINLMVQDFGGQDVKLDQYVEISEKEVDYLITKGKIILSETIRDGKTEYHKIIYTGEQGIFKLKFEQYFWVIDNEAYVLTLTCEENQFDEYQKLGEEILNSFKIKSYINTIHIEDFNWTITIPKSLSLVDKSEQEERINKGEEAIEKTTGEDIVNEAVTIFAYKNGQITNLEALWQPFDEEVDGEYLETYSEVNNIIYQIFETQMPNAKLDSISSKQKVNDLEFYRFDMTIDFPDGIKIKVIRFSRLFDKKELAINIKYADEKIGENMLTAFLNSKFE